MSLARDDRQRPAIRSEPGTNTDDQTRVGRAFVRCPREGSGVSEPAFVNDADIRGELARNLLTEAQANLCIGEPCTYADVGDVLSRKAKLQSRLEDQALCQALVVFTRYAGT